ncbi:MAG: hypothetical protein IOD12_07985 [Silvanigrellales bacterium]|nr:hypothetical protein [Silvanigrellales bacterium]
MREGFHGGQESHASAAFGAQRNETRLHVRGIKVIGSLEAFGARGESEQEEGGEPVRREFNPMTTEHAAVSTFPSHFLAQRRIPWNAVNGFFMACTRTSGSAGGCTRLKMERFFSDWECTLDLSKCPT